MCGIVGYIGKNSKNICSGLEALKRLEYRGYDSSGVAFFDSAKKEIVCLKAAGRISSLENKIETKEKEGKKEMSGNPFIFHTRWATHGVPSEVNAHPHFDNKKNIFLVHNGIIENYKDLKKMLEEKGCKFVSETDTEVLAHLISFFFKGNLEEAVRKALKMVKGTYGLAVISRDDPEKLVVARNSSPLLLALGNGEFWVASDPSAVLAYSKKIIFLEDGEIAVITKDDFSVSDLNNQKKEKKVSELKWSFEEVQKGGYSHFMLKEIFEEPEAIKNSIRGRLIEGDGMAKLGGLELVEEKLREIERIIIVSCGTAHCAGLVGEYMLEEYAGVPVEVDTGSEFRYRKSIINKKTAVLCISQSGETADTLAALREAKRKGALVLGITNVVGSTQARETDAGVYNHCGSEIAVASTKAFISQLTVLVLLTVYLGRQRDMSLVMGRRIVQEIKKLPKLVEKVLTQKDIIKKIAKKYSEFNNFLFLGRKYNYPIAIEGALKLKEVSYLHAEGCPAGEMKHGIIALINEDFPTFAICLSDSVYEKMLSNIEEIKARKGLVIALATEGNKEIKKIADDVIYIPKTLEMLSPILASTPLHLFAAYVGLEKGHDIDKPRNLAKSVTVE
ncbi:glutamine--fructose-6-phosphate transaminase (isomerizing) [Candidatus Parcubacteria bacterium A4]|nr:MAG: glutamine--fructose-6-phosphate transaminase (isomerizing) [Candidatus Parcubacteria bacterium A4]